MIEIVNGPGENQLYGHAFVSPVRDPDHVKLDVSSLTPAEVDAQGYLKPNVPLRQNGARVSAPGQIVHGVTIEAIKLPGRTGSANLATDTTDPLVAVATSGLLNRDIARDNLGRVFTPDELSALAAGGFKVTTTD